MVTGDGHPVLLVNPAEANEVGWHDKTKGVERTDISDTWWRWLMMAGGRASAVGFLLAVAAAFRCVAD